MPIVRFVRILLIAIVSAFGLSSAAFATPADIVAVSEAWDLSTTQKTISVAALDRESFYTQALDQVEQIARTRGYPSSFSKDNKAIVQALSLIHI